ncbi:32049_t:CDS:2, partial [Gigaspora margarita]
SKHNTAETFNITTKQLRDWIKKKELELASPFVRRLNISSCLKYLLLENELKTWIRTLHSSQKVVNSNYIYVDVDASDSESVVDLTLNNNTNENNSGSDSLDEENRNDD